MECYIIHVQVRHGYISTHASQITIEMRSIHINTGRDGKGRKTKSKEICDQGRAAGPYTKLSSLFLQIYNPFCAAQKLVPVVVDWKKNNHTYSYTNNNRYFTVKLQVPTGDQEQSAIIVDSEQQCENFFFLGGQHRRYPTPERDETHMESSEKGGPPDMPMRLPHWTFTS